MATEYNDHVEITTDNAILLLAAAQELGQPAEVVETTSTGYFRVPQDVVDKAGLGSAHKQSSKTPSEKTTEKVTEPVVYGDPMSEGDPEPFTNPTPLIPLQDEEAERKQATEQARQAPARRTAKKAPAKKAAANKQKSE